MAEASPFTPTACRLLLCLPHSASRPPSATTPASQSSRPSYALQPRAPSSRRCRATDLPFTRNATNEEAFPFEECDEHGHAVKGSAHAWRPLPSASPDSVMASGWTEPARFTLPPTVKSAKEMRKRRHKRLLAAAFLICAAVIAADLTAALVKLGVQAAREALPNGVELSGVALAGFAAQLVDGSLGMGYGVTSATVLVSTGVSPTIASASVHLAQLGTTAASGLAHLHLRNVDGAAAACLALPGVLGALGGAALLASLPAAATRPVAGSLLFTLGVVVLLKFRRPPATPAADAPPARRMWLLPVGLVGGFVDATGGGGWGPVATTCLLAQAQLPPAIVIGTVSASEFFVTLAAVLGFLLTLGPHVGGGGVRPDLVLALLAGGLCAAPIAPLLVKRLRPCVLGSVVGGFICMTNMRVLLQLAGVEQSAPACYAGMSAVWAAAVCNAARKSCVDAPAGKERSE